MLAAFYLLGITWQDACAEPVVGNEIIVVTAERRAHRADEIAGNTATLDQQELQRIGSQHPAEVLNRLSGVAMQRGSGVESLPAVRSPVLSGGQAAGSFLILEDGVPIRAPAFANVNQVFETSLEFASGVEVTRGPGSALYGSNAVHGLINVITPDAAPGASAEIEGGSFGRWRSAGLISGEHALLGFSARHENGWRADAGLDQQRILAGWDAAAGPWDVRARLAAVNLNQETAGFVIGHDAYKNEALARANDNPEAFRDSQIVRLQAEFTREIGDTWRLSLIPYGRRIDTDLLLHFFPSRALEESRQRGGGLQAALYYDPRPDFSLIMGADLDRTAGDLTETQTRATLASPPGYVQGVHYDYTVDASVAALYAQTRWAFAPNWSLTAGLRGERTQYEYDNHTAEGDFGRFRRPADRTDRFSTLTPKFGVVRAFDGGGSAYFSLTRGARAPQVSDLYSLQTNQQAGGQDVETLDAAELGLRLPIGPGRIEAALYAMDKRHGAFRNAAGFTVDAATRHLGLELSATLPVGDRFDVSGWVTYAEHTYEFSDAAEGIVKGADADTAPHWIANAALLWRPAPVFEAELSWTRMGAYFTDAANAHAYPGHDVFDLRAAWQFRDGYELFGAIRNLTEVRYAERADFAFGAERYFPGEGLAISMGLRVRR